MSCKKSRLAGGQSEAGRPKRPRAARSSSRGVMAQKLSDERHSLPSPSFIRSSQGNNCFCDFTLKTTGYEALKVAFKSSATIRT